MNDLHNYQGEKGLAVVPLSFFFLWVFYFTRTQGWQRRRVKGKLKACGGGIELSISISWNNLKRRLRAARGVARQKWEVTGGLTEVQVRTENGEEEEEEGRLLGTGQFNRGIQSWLPLLGVDWVAPCHCFIPCSRLCFLHLAEKKHIYLELR